MSRNDPRTQRDRLALEPVRVARAIPPLLVVADDGREVPRHAQRVTDALADLGMLAHDAELVVRQRPGLVEDVLGDVTSPDDLTSIDRSEVRDLLGD